MALIGHGGAGMLALLVTLIVSAATRSSPKRTRSGAATTPAPARELKMKVAIGLVGLVPYGSLRPEVQLL